MGTEVEAYLARLAACADAMGRAMAPVSPSDRLLRLTERDAHLAELGFRSALLRIEHPNRVRTADPFQDTAWLVEDAPARPCWEYLPHMAGYVEWVQELGYPVAAVRFETPGTELNLDLAALDEAGAVLVLGEVKREPRQVDGLERLLPGFAGDPGKAPPRSVPGAPSGARREAWKLAHQLWQTRAPHLWLVAAGVRRAFDVEYRDMLVLHRRAALPRAVDLWPAGFSAQTPRLAANHGGGP